jgi:hypothetical protein
VAGVWAFAVGFLAWIVVAVLTSQMFKEVEGWQSAAPLLLQLAVFLATSIWAFRNYTKGMRPPMT